MNVGELKKIIEGLPEDMQIVLQKDAEGNGYSPLSSTDTNSVYISDNPWSGFVFPINWTAQDAGISEENWEQIKAQPCSLILIPTN